jgi:hypothetical protein
VRLLNHGQPGSSPCGRSVWDRPNSFITFPNNCAAGCCMNAWATLALRNCVAIIAALSRQSKTMEYRTPEFASAIPLRGTMTKALQPHRAMPPSSKTMLPIPTPNGRTRGWQ